jgi:hypothetical protein
MKDNKNQKCVVCGKEQAKTECDNCGIAICGDCCKLEIWGSGAEDLSARYFCPTCKEDPDVNPWGAHGNVVNKATVTKKAEVKNILVAGSKRLSVKKEKSRSTGYGNYRNTHLPADNGMHASAHK